MCLSDAKFYIWIFIIYTTCFVPDKVMNIYKYIEKQQQPNAFIVSILVVWIIKHSFSLRKKNYLVS